MQGILHSALHNEYWRLIDPQGKPTGVMGWWPSRAVTFLENHDTGSTQVSLLKHPDKEHTHAHRKNYLYYNSPNFALLTRAFSYNSCK